MPRHDNLSPNVPDVMPDYVDLPRSTGATAVLEPPPEPVRSVPAAQAATEHSTEETRQAEPEPILTESPAEPVQDEST
ncbi:MAG: hypothetical protein LIQ31_12080, partial [Planctomycetes bacterium]|nr:hypothetical protein [Planctomycetota bacterium]